VPGDAKGELQRELGPGLEIAALLSEQESAALLTRFREVRREQKQALDVAIEESLNHLPRPIRGTARKIMFG
jgi:hypothetical protein